MSYVILPYEGVFTVYVSALNVYGESQPNAKKLCKFYVLKLA